MKFEHLHAVPDFVLLLRLEMKIYGVYFQATRILGIALPDNRFSYLPKRRREMQFHKSEGSSRPLEKLIMLGMQLCVPSGEKLLQKSF